MTTDPRYRNDILSLDIYFRTKHYEPIPTFGLRGHVQEIVKGTKSPPVIPLLLNEFIITQLSKRRMENLNSTVFDSVSNWIGTTQDLFYPVHVSNNKAAFMLVMNRVYQLGMRRSPVKAYP